MIRIKSKQAGFRRCGMAHPAEAVEYPNARFTAAELAILQAEPMLVVDVVQKPLPPLPADLVEASAPYPDKAADSGKEPVKAGKKGKR